MWIWEYILNGPGEPYADCSGSDMLTFHLNMKQCKSMTPWKYTLGVKWVRSCPIMGSKISFKGSLFGLFSRILNEVNIITSNCMAEAKYYSYLCFWQGNNVVTWLKDGKKLILLIIFFFIHNTVSPIWAVHLKYYVEGSLMW